MKFQFSFFLIIRLVIISGNKTNICVRVAKDQILKSIFFNFYLKLAAILIFVVLLKVILILKVNIMRVSIYLLVMVKMKVSSLSLCLSDIIYVKYKGAYDHYLCFIIDLLAFQLILPVLLLLIASL